MRSNLWLLLGCALPLVACSHTGGAEGGSSGAPGSLPAAQVADAPHTCDPEKLKGLEGQAATEATVQKAVRDSGARNARVVKPGMAVTMDFREDRLTVHVDEQNRIVRISCG